MVRDFFGKMKEKFRAAMLVPGGEDYYPDEHYEDDYYEEVETAPAPARVAPKSETWQEVARAATAPKSSLGGKYESKIVELYGRKTAADITAQIALTSPKNVSNSNVVTDFVKDGKICAVNLTGVERGQAQRIVDVVAGGIYALNGTINRISKDIFIVAPEGVHVSGELREELAHDFPWKAAR